MGNQKYNQGMIMAAKNKLGAWLRSQRIEFLTDRETDNMLIDKSTVIKPHFKVEDKTYIHVMFDITPREERIFHKFSETFGNILVIPVDFIRFHINDYSKEDINDYFKVNI